MKPPQTTRQLLYKLQGEFEEVKSQLGSSSAGEVAPHDSGEGDDGHLLAYQPEWDASTAGERALCTISRTALRGAQRFKRADQEFTSAPSGGQMEGVQVLRP